VVTYSVVKSESLPTLAYVLSNTLTRYPLDPCSIMTWVTTNVSPNPITRWLIPHSTSQTAQHRTCPACRTPILSEPDNRPIEEITDAEVSQTLNMVEQLLQNHLEELRVIRENASRPRSEQGVGTDGDEEEEDGGGDEDDDLDLDGLLTPEGFPDLDLDGLLTPGGLPDSERPPSNPQIRGRSRSPPEEYHGMYS